MTSVRKIAALVTCVVLVGGAAIIWPVYKKKAAERKLAEAARVRAGEGDADAQYKLGNAYAQGQGVPRDYAESVRWYRKAGDQGDKSAQSILAVMYFKGQKVPKDYVEAIRWLGKVAASCFWRAEGPLARWTSIAIILLGAPILVVPQRRWGRATWLPLALSSAVCVAMLAHELSPSSVAGMVQGLMGAQYEGFGRVLWLAILAGVSATYVFGAIAGALRSRRGSDQVQPAAEA